MAVIPLELARPNVPGPGGVARVPMGSPVGEAIQGLGATMATLEAATKKARQDNAVSQARVAHLTGLSDLRGELEKAPPDADIIGLFDQRRTERRRAIAEAMPDSGARAAFEGEATLVEARDRMEILRLGARRTAEAGRAALDGELSTYADQVAAERNPVRRQSLLDAATASITARVDTGVLGADDGEKLRQGFRGRLSQAEALGLIRDNPAGAMAAIADPARLPGLDPAARERLMNSATSAMSARASQAAAAEARSMRLVQQSADIATNRLTEQMELARDGKAPPVTLADLARYRDVLPGSSYRVLASAVREAGGPGAKPGDARTLLELDGLVDTAPPAEFQRRVAGAVEVGQISAAEGLALQGRNRTARRDDAPPSPFQSGRSMVKASLDPGDVPMQAFAREQWTQRQVNAIADYDAWARQNPAASAADAETQARGIVTRYREITGGQLKQTLPMPFGFAGSRNAVTEETLRAAAQKVLASGLPPDQIAREAGNLEAWRTTLGPAAKPAAPAAPAGRGGGASTRPARTE